MNELFQTQYENFKTVNMEGMNDHGYSTALSKKDFIGQTNAISAMGVDYANSLQQQNNNYYSLNTDINYLQGLPKTNPEIEIINKNNIINSDINKAREEDSEMLLLQHNYLYILGTITFAIVAIGGIVILKN